jgi:hypothetical protein
VALTPARHLEFTGFDSPQVHRLGSFHSNSIDKKTFEEYNPSADGEPDQASRLNSTKDPARGPLFFLYHGKRKTGRPESRPVVERNYSASERRFSASQPFSIILMILFIFNYRFFPSMISCATFWGAGS